MQLFHRVFGDRLDRELPDHEVAYFAMGCFWGAEKLFWTTPGVRLTAVGYMGGRRPDPSYEQVCTGVTGHAETVRVVFDPSRTSYAELLRIFFENHDPTQGDRQGNDVGAQYRSVVFTTSDEQSVEAHRTRDEFQQALSAADFGTITTTIEPAGEFWWAEERHQQYLEANPAGYQCHTKTGVCFAKPALLT